MAVGEGKASGTWNDMILVHDLPDYRAPGAQVWNLGIFARGAELESLGSYTVSQSINLSPAVRGHYVTVLTDIPPQQVDESDDRPERSVGERAHTELLGRERHDHVDRT